MNPKKPASEIIGASHEFHDEAYSCDWAKRFVPTPARRQLFETLYRALMASIAPASRIVELGIGPGYFAEYLLGEMPSVHYYGIDFSAPMLELARARLANYSARTELIRADLVLDEWWASLPLPIDGVVSTWALHDLGGEVMTAKVYSACRSILRSGGIFLNGDFIKPDHTKHEYEPGRFMIGRHIGLLQQVGFSEAECLIVLGPEIENPTAAQNYACFRAWA